MAGDRGLLYRKKPLLSLGKLKLLLKPPILSERFRSCVGKELVWDQGLLYRKKSPSILPLSSSSPPKNTSCFEQVPGIAQLA